MELANSRTTPFDHSIVDPAYDASRPSRTGWSVRHIRSVTWTADQLPESAYQSNGIP